MSRGINKVVLIGNVGRTPDVLVSTENHAAKATLTLATSERWTDPHTQEKVEQTEWHRVVCYGRLAEVAGNYVKAGTLLYVDGKLQTRKWQDKDGHDRYTTEVISNDIQLLSKSDKHA